MGEAKHTPGPWFARKKHDAPLHEGTHWIGCGNGALGYWRGHKDHHNDSNWVLNEADANLISAAPDLLAALKNFVDGCSLSVDAAAVAMAAIAKAEGRQE